MWFLQQFLDTAQCHSEIAVPNNCGILERMGKFSALQGTVGGRGAQVKCMKRELCAPVVHNSAQWCTARGEWRKRHNDVPKKLLQATMFLLSNVPRWHFLCRTVAKSSKVRQFFGTAMPCLHTPRAPVAHSVHPVCKGGAEHTALTHWACNMCTDRCTVHGQCTIQVHTKLHYGRALYIESALTGALLTDSGNYKCTHRCSVHVQVHQCTVQVHCTLKLRGIIRGTRLMQ